MDNWDIGEHFYLTFYHTRSAFGLFILPLVLGLVAVAGFAADPEPFAREPASQVWGIIHGTSILLGTVAVLVGFAAGLMYLRQAYRLKHKLAPQRGPRLPSLEWLQRTNSRAIVISVLMLGLGVLSGLVLNLINHAGRLPWHDPVVLSTTIMLAWLVLSAGLGALYKPARHGRKVAYLTVVSFVFLVVALSIGFFVDTQHGAPRSERGGLEDPEVAVWGSVLNHRDPPANGTLTSHHRPPTTGSKYRLLPARRNSA